MMNQLMNRSLLSSLSTHNLTETPLAAATAHLGGTATHLGPQASIDLPGRLVKICFTMFRQVSPYLTLYISIDVHSLPRLPVVKAGLLTPFQWFSMRCLVGILKDHLDAWLDGGTPQVNASLRIGDSGDA